ncbi:MAG: 1-acyl-sn-glycerol-3-phosphate acyltransferase [Alphaproteobacteria bacterium]|jgi:lyso-ornithine lipid O-acyltransferase|nr:1-acyl-sn-glycerol-3-phosphate acyltransferase [Alphaproteobacteria bacterium]MBT5389528.1 1-acyl-sn-glycerol-3-phosphate acyltransferase [Alphaproteobacteria bacterium]MBT5540826.1 1-acyl-sn-glycerol-3-phosphate acyltransferase [Alphaproteobacteria bacterium]MBT5653891.1 1-acyl-sn-glycerol-3-phosphate acyltransferase [Alphaproteobacteria bacterium]
MFLHNVRSFTRLGLSLGLTVLFLPIQFITNLFLKNSSFPSKCTFFILTYSHRLLGIRINCIGKPSTLSPTLFVSNHISYLDINILGSILPAAFIAKAQVRKWPIFGLYAKLQGSIFIDRTPHTIKAQLKAIGERLKSGKNLVLFPEGTSNDGTHVLPFKSSLFAFSNIDRPLYIQPVTITYAQASGMPLGRNLRNRYAWFGDLTLPPHLHSLSREGKVTVNIRFHEPVDASNFSSRKELATYCHEQVSQGMSDTITGKHYPQQRTSNA